MRIQILENAKQGFLDISGESPAMLNLSISDIKDVSKLSGSYSNTLQISNTKEAQIILGHYFDVAISQDSTVYFDSRKKVRVALIEDGIIFQDNLIMQLKEVKVSNFLVVGYSVELYDDVAELFNSISNKELTDLDFSDGDHTLTASLIKSTFNKTSSNSVFKYHLTANENNNYNIAQFKPAIWAKHYLARIGATNGIQFNLVDSDIIKFSKWLIPCSRSNYEKRAEPIIKAQRTIDTPTNSIKFSFTPTDIDNSAKQIIFDTETFDPSNLYNTATGEAKAVATFTIANAMHYEIDLEVELKIKNNDSQMVFKDPFTFYDNQIAVEATTRKGALIKSRKTSEVLWTIDHNVVLTAGEERTISTKKTTLIVPCGNLTVNDLIKFYFATKPVQTSNWLFTNGNTATQQPSFKTTVKSASIRVVANVEGGFNTGNRIKLNNFIPDKVKQSDFLKMITTLNNMWVIKEDVNKFKLIRREEYLQGGKVVDWSDKLNHDNYTLSPISELTNKENVYSYKEDKDQLNEAYKSTRNEVYGQFRFVFDSEHVRGQNKIEIPFSPTPIIKTNFNAYVPAIDGMTPKHNARVLIDGGIMTCSPYRISETGQPSLVINDGYGYCGHFDNPINPALDLNFGTCDFYFFQRQGLTTNNMYNLNWRNTCYQINSGRILKGEFNLSINDVRTFEFSHRVFCLGQYWNVNSIKVNVNRKAGSEGYLAIVELITATDVDKVLPTKGNVGGKKPNPLVGAVIDDSFVNGAIGGLLLDLVKFKNTYLGGGAIQVIGSNNTIEQGVTNALVVGDNQTITENGIFTPNVNITDSGVVYKFRMLDAGKDVTLSFGGLSVGYQVVDAGKDNIISFGGTKDFKVVDAKKDEI